MAATGKGSVIVELYDLPITERKDDRFGRVVITRSLTEDDLVREAVSRRTDLNAVTLKASLDILKEIALEEVINGASVRFGLGYFKLKANGVFIGDNARWDSSQHSLDVHVTPTSEFRNAVKATSVDVRGMATLGTAINSVTDMASGGENTRLTPGGGVNISGSRIKIDGDDPDVGIFLTCQDTGKVTVIPKTSIPVNYPSKLTFIVPADLPAGDYKLSVCTQFASHTLLKQPRTYTFRYLLNVPG